jgi:NADPH2:quinone reductase
VTELKVGDRVADMTVVGSDATYRLLKVKDLTLLPKGIDPAEAAT